MPTRTEIIEAGARAIAGEYDRRAKLKPGSWRSGKHRRHELRKEAEAALSAMLPLIKAQLAAEVRDGSQIIHTREGCEL